jgi:anti-sigma-K factor RskA
VNIEEYISSGILESYVLGELTERERQPVERNLTMYPALRDELSKIELSVEELAMRTAIAPPASVKAALMKKIDSQGSVPKNNVRSLNASVWKYATAASVSIALVASYLAYSYWDKWRTTVISLNELLERNQQIAQDYNTVNNRITQIEKDINVLNDPAFKRIVMNGTPNAPGAMAYVYWNEKSNEVYLSLQNMRELSQEQQYQLWAIVDGKPVDCGVFDGNVAGLVKMKSAAKVATFAVTIEPRGGKPSPSLETMQVAGNT